MTDLLTAHATNQPDELAVVDDRGGGNVHELTFAWGETATASVVAKPGSDLHDGDVIADARRHLAHDEVRRSMSWLDEPPETGSGKVLGRGLRQPFRAGHGSNV